MNYTRTAALSLLLIVGACTVQQESLSDSHDSASSKISIIHLNDTYRVGDVEEGRRGGFGRVATLVKNLQADGREVHITHGGDLLFPSLESQLWNGAQMVEALNYLNSLAPVYFVPGNHEFDKRDAGAVVDAVRASEFAWIADNLEFDTGEEDVDATLQKSFVFSAGGPKPSRGSFGSATGPGRSGRSRRPGGVYREPAAEALRTWPSSAARIALSKRSPQGSEP